MWYLKDQIRNTRLRDLTFTVCFVLRFSCIYYHRLCSVFETKLSSCLFLTWTSNPLLVLHIFSQYGQRWAKPSMWVSTCFFILPFFIFTLSQALQDQPRSDLTTSAWIFSSSVGFFSLNFTTVVFSSIFKPELSGFPSKNRQFHKIEIR